MLTVRCRYAQFTRLTNFSTDHAHVAQSGPRLGIGVLMGHTGMGADVGADPIRTSATPLRRQALLQDALEVAANAKAPEGGQRGAASQRVRALGFAATEHPDGRKGGKDEDQKPRVLAGAGATSEQEREISC